MPDVTRLNTFGGDNVFLLNRLLIRVPRPLMVVAAALLFAGVLTLIGVRVTMAAALGQEVPPELSDFLVSLLKLSAWALLIIPVAEVRKLFGGLPDIPLPGGRVIKAGRWFSWLVALPVMAFGHYVGWLAAPDLDNFQAWFIAEMAIGAIIANIVYANWWQGQVGLDIEVTPTPPA